MKRAPNFSCWAFVLAAVLTACAGCAGPSNSLQSTTKYTVEDTGKFLPLDQASQAAVACTGLQERTLADGRLQVVANIKNREAQLVVVQVQCVFRDVQGFDSGGESAWRTLILPEDSTEVVRFTAANAQAVRYAIRVRQPQ